MGRRPAHTLAPVDAGVASASVGDAASTGPPSRDGQWNGAEHSARRRRETLTMSSGLVVIFVRMIVSFAAQWWRMRQ